MFPTLNSMRHETQKNWNDLKKEDGDESKEIACKNFTVEERYLFLVLGKIPGAKKRSSNN